jgi:Protein phosphatase 2C
MTHFGVEVQHYLTQKLGTDRNECEDSVGFSLGRNAFAVADGATEAFASRYWSRLLVKSWVRHPLASPKSQFLEMARLLGERVTRRWSSKQLPWYAEEKARAGSFAAFVGAVLEFENERIRWRAIAVGDSCFIQTRKQKIVCSVPLSESEHFGFRPVLLPSNPSKYSTILEEAIYEYEGFAEAGDTFFLLSDAVASWFIEAKKVNASYITEFERLLGSGLTSDLDIFFDEQRSTDRMRNDDIAAVCVRIVAIVS